MGEQIIEEIKNPPQQSLTIKTTSVLISRMVKADKKDEFKTIILRFFDINNPHLTQAFPKKIIVYNNTEKARLMGLNVSYYLEGNDLVVNDLAEVYIERENNRLYIKGKQRNVNRR